MLILIGSVQFFPAKVIKQRGNTSMWHSIRKAAMFIGTLGLVTSIFPTADAQNFPTRGVKLVVAAPPGGVTDIMARIVGQRLSESWNQSVIVENRAGANFAAGAQSVAAAPPDGLTLLVAPDAMATAAPHLFSNLPYDPVNDLTPIVVLCRITPVLAVNPSLPVHNVEELVALAKSKPGLLNYGSFGIGHYSHLSMEDFKQRTGTNIMQIPYRGQPQAVVALLSGDVGMMLSNYANIEEHVKAGKIRIIAIAGDTRSAVLPNLATVAESGVPGYSTTGWFGLWGPPKMAPELVKKIHDDVSMILDLPQSRDFFQNNSFERVNITSNQMSQLIQDDSKHWGALIKAVGAKLD
jgi:tripartite-type tricarboxylate transporter receptor subunit TctC